MTQLASPTFYAQEYRTSLQLALQQRGSKLRQVVTNGPMITGAKQAVVVDRIEPGVAQAVGGQLQDKVYQNPATLRLWVNPVSYDYSQTLDHFEKLKMLSDPSSSWVTAAQYAIGRAVDDEIIAAMFRATASGEAGAGTQAFDTANQQIAVNYDAGGNVGLTVAKLKRARQRFIANEVDLDREEMYCVVTDDQDKNLLDEAQYINLDFGDRPVLEDGKLKKFLGINFVHCQRLGVDGSGYRRVPVFTKSAIELRMWEDITTSVNRLTNKRGEPWEVYAMSTFGAARTDNKLICEVLCAEA